MRPGLNSVTPGQRNKIVHLQQTAMFKSQALVAGREPKPRCWASYADRGCLAYCGEVDLALGLGP